VVHESFGAIFQMDFIAALQTPASGVFQGMLLNRFRAAPS